MTALLTKKMPLLTGLPDGIRKLRELILDLAVRGKLVPQSPNDEPASELLKRIAEEKSQLLAEGKIKKQKPLADVSLEEKPYDVPESWAWTRLGEITSFGITTKQDDIPDEAWVLDLEDIEKHTSRLLQKVRFLERKSLSDKNSFAKGDVLYGKLRPYLNKVVVAEDDGFCTTEIIPFRCHGPFVAHYFMVALKSTYFLDYVNSKSYGMKMPRLGTEDGRQALFPLPPLTEQQRIVAKVDELMALCDRIEGQQADAKIAHMHLVHTLLGSVTQAGDCAASWKRISENFHSLFVTESSVNALKKTVLQLAVMGKLVAQDPGDEPANKLLERIDAEKAQLLENGLIKRQKPLSKVDKRDVPFDLPDSWTWARFGSVCAVRGELVRPEDFPALRQIAPDCIEKGTGRLTDERTVEEAGVKGPNSRFFAGQIVYSKIRPSLSKAVLVDFDGLCSADMYPIDSFVDSNFLLREILSEVFLEQVRVAENRVKMPKINQESLMNFLLPIPPLSEQRRIVAKVVEVFALCDQLKEAIVDAEGICRKMANALVELAVVEEPPASAPNVIHLSSYLVRKLAAQSTFGRTAHMKWLFIADQHLGLELGMTYERQAAGPLDKLIYQVEEQAAQLQLYATQKETLKSGIEKIGYRPDVAIDRAADAGAAELGDKRAELDRLIGLLGAHKAEDLEIVATLYAVWNDALAEGQQPDDGWLINEFRTNWHKGKERFSPELLAKWLSWMREHRLVPAGKISSTRHQGSLLH